MDKLFQQNPDLAFAFLGGICVLLIIQITIGIMFLLSMQKALTRVSPRNRLMEPAQVWFMFIPCVNFVWQFMIAIRIPDSLKREFQDRGKDDGSDYGKTLGLSYCILGIVFGIISNVLTRIPDLELIGIGVSLGSSVLNILLGILFWVKIVGYSNQIAESDDYDTARKLDRFDDDDDDGYGKASSPRRRTDSSDGIQEGDGGGGKYQ